MIITLTQDETQQIAFEALCDNLGISMEDYYVNSISQGGIIKTIIQPKDKSKSVPVTIE